MKNWRLRLSPENAILPLLLLLRFDESKLGKGSVVEANMKMLPSMVVE